MTHFIKPCDGRLTSPFGYRTHPVTGAKGSFHQGIDLAQSGDVKVNASADGVVLRVGALGTYGNVVMIRHIIEGKTYETNYAHLKPNILVRVGQKVKQGEQIAWMGNTGSSTGQHLHFEIHDGVWASGQPNAVDPMQYIVEKEVIPVEKTRYSDVGKSSAAYDALERITPLNIIKGFSDGTFRPNEPLTRGQAAIIADRIITALKG